MSPIQLLGLSILSSFCKYPAWCIFVCWKERHLPCQYTFFQFSSVNVPMLLCNVFFNRCVERYEKCELWYSCTFLATNNGKTYRTVTWPYWLYPHTYMRCSMPILDWLCPHTYMRCSMPILDWLCPTLQLLNLWELWSWSWQRGLCQGPSA